MPTRHGRNAYAFTEDGPVKMRNAKHIEDTGPIEARCDCYCCANYTRSAIRHYFNVNEMLGPILVSIHNIRFYQRLMQKIRDHVKAGDIGRWGSKRLEKYMIFNENNP